MVANIKIAVTGSKCLLFMDPDSVPEVFHFSNVLFAVSSTFYDINNVICCTIHIFFNFEWSWTVVEEYFACFCQKVTNAQFVILATYCFCRIFSCNFSWIVELCSC